MRVHGAQRLCTEAIDQLRLSLTYLRCPSVSVKVWALLRVQRRDHCVSSRRRRRHRRCRRRGLVQRQRAATPRARLAPVLRHESGTVAALLARLRRQWAFVGVAAPMLGRPWDREVLSLATTYHSGSWVQSGERGSCHLEERARRETEGELIRVSAALLLGGQIWASPR